MPAATNPPALVWDAMSKEARGKAGDTNVSYTFYCTNVSPAEVLINYTQSSCGCTVASLPSYPYRIPSGDKGKIDIVMDVRGKYGVVNKTVTVYTSFGQQTLTLIARLPDPIAQLASVKPPAMSEQQRILNQNIAKTDRQAVFVGDCGRCHAEPAKGRLGKALFDLACGVCHDAENRASMVPDLRNPKRPARRDYWVQWVMFGKPNTLMPAFAKANGGILTDEQIFSLVEHLVGPFQQTTNVVKALTAVSH
jgi:mono/diheme cytochrome c family protein